MDGQALKIAAAGCFALVILVTSVTSRFDVRGGMANVFTTLGGTTTSDASTTIPVPTSQEWKSSLSKYATIDPAIASSSAAYASSTMTMTDTFARSMFESYLRNRGEIDASGSRVTFAQDYANALLLSIEPPTYTASDVKVSETATLSVYISALSQAIAQTGGVNEHELAIFERLTTATESGVNEEDVASLLKIANSYERIEKELKTLLVPKDSVATHLAFLTAITGVRTHIINMSTIAKDPLRAAAGFRAYVDSVEKLSAAIATLQLNVKIEQITFPEGSTAARFMEL